MQLHPGDSSRSAYYALKSILRGMIGLDFRTDVGDLRNPTGSIETNQLDYRLFESEMKPGDLVLVMAHHIPLALVEISSDYVYIPTAREDFDVWFRHIRFVKNIRLYADWISNPKDIVAILSFSPKFLFCRKNCITTILETLFSKMA